MPRARARLRLCAALVFFSLVQRAVVFSLAVATSAISRVRAFALVCARRKARAYARWQQICAFAPIRAPVGRASGRTIETRRRCRRRRCRRRRLCRDRAFVVAFVDRATARADDDGNGDNDSDGGDGDGNHHGGRARAALTASRSLSLAVAHCRPLASLITHARAAIRMCARTLRCGMSARVPSVGVDHLKKHNKKTEKKN